MAALTAFTAASIARQDAKCALIAVAATEAAAATAAQTAEAERAANAAIVAPSSVAAAIATAAAPVAVSSIAASSDAGFDLDAAIRDAQALLTHAGCVAIARRFSDAELLQFVGANGVEESTRRAHIVRGIRAIAAAPSRAISTASPSSRSISAMRLTVRRSSSTKSTTCLEISSPDIRMASCNSPANAEVERRAGIWRSKAAP